MNSLFVLMCVQAIGFVNSLQHIPWWMASTSSDVLTAVQYEQCALNETLTYNFTHSAHLTNTCSSGNTESHMYTCTNGVAIYKYYNSSTNCTGNVKSTLEQSCINQMMYVCVDVSGDFVMTDHCDGNKTHFAITKTYNIIQPLNVCTHQMNGFAKIVHDVNTNMLNLTNCDTGASHIYAMLDACISGTLYRIVNSKDVRNHGSVNVMSSLNMIVIAVMILFI